MIDVGGAERVGKSTPIQPCCHSNTTSMRKLEEQSIVATLRKQQHHANKNSVAAAVWSGQSARAQPNNGLPENSEHDDYVARMGRWRKDTLVVCSCTLFDAVILVAISVWQHNLFVLWRHGSNILKSHLNTHVMWGPVCGFTRPTSLNSCLLKMCWLGLFGFG